MMQWFKFYPLSQVLNYYSKKEMPEIYFVCAKMVHPYSCIRVSPFPVTKASFTLQNTQRRFKKVTVGDVYSHLQWLFNLDVGLHVSGALYVHVKLVRIVENTALGDKKLKHMCGSSLSIAADSFRISMN